MSIKEIKTTCYCYLIEVNFNIRYNNLIKEPHRMETEWLTTYSKRSVCTVAYGFVALNTYEYEIIVRFALFLRLNYLFIPVFCIHANDMQWKVTNLHFVLYIN